MQTETVIKVLNRYVKGLKMMRDTALAQGDIFCSNQYEFDRLAIEQAMNELKERSNTES